MRRVILDTNFIITCIKQKIDFFEELKFMGFQVLIPEQVVRETKGIANSRKKLHFREDARLALELLDKNKFDEVDLKTKKVDEGLVRYAEENSDIFVATLDREIKKKTTNSKVVIREKKRLEVV